MTVKERKEIMNNQYADNLNVQLLISLLKKHKIKKIIVSPGSTHMEFVASIQTDDWFELYSCLDERGAAYMACGMAEETQQPVVLTCTEATASRNYIPGLTEAYYRKLPVLAVTGLRSYHLIGNLEPQVIDRSVSPNDVFVEKVDLPEIKDGDDRWYSELKINQALLALKRRGGGPVHINLPRSSTTYNFDVQTPVEGKKISRYSYNDALPELPKGRIAIICWAHVRWPDDVVRAIEAFCENHNAVVMCDLTSGYHGKYRFSPSLLAVQKMDFDLFHPDLIINIGEGTGDYNVLRKFTGKTISWRVNPDGEIRDPMKNIVNVFEMNEAIFFEKYRDKSIVKDHSYYVSCLEADKKIRSSMPDLPFSNMYVAREVSSRLPANSVIHFGMSNTIRAWSNFEYHETIESYINVGCRGIDGTLSSLVGASIVNKNKLHYGVLGDLSFFYDMNSLGNRDIGNNLRIIVINNNGGSLFKKNTGPEHKWFSFEDIDKYIAAANHFGGKDSDVIMHYAKGLGFEYLRASNKDEFTKQLSNFLSSSVKTKPMIFEVRTNDEDEAKSFELMGSIMIGGKDRFKSAVKGVIGAEGINSIKKILGQEKKAADFTVGKK